MIINYQWIMNNNSKEITVDNNKYILRDANKEDKEFIFKVLKDNMLHLYQKHWGYWNEKSFDENYHEEHMRIIEHKGVKIGYLDFKFKVDCGYVNNIQVVENFRNKGLGTAIMRLVEQETITRELNKIRLKTFKDSGAINLYKRIGYKQISEDDTSIIMEKEIINDNS